MDEFGELLEIKRSNTRDCKIEQTEVVEDMERSYTWVEMWVLLYYFWFLGNDTGIVGHLIQV